MEKFKKVNARELLTTNRIDLMAKYIYVEAYVKNKNINWAKEIYCKHIEAFSGGGFHEPGNELKNSIDKYLSTFNELIDSILSNGIDENISQIPISKDGYILDGAHRTAICAYLGKEVPIYLSEGSGIYNYDFFKNMLLEQKYLDAMVTKFVEINGSNLFFFIIWPSAYKNTKCLDVADKIIAQYDVLAKKDVEINYNGLRNFMIQAYQGFEWCGNESNHYSGVEGKVAPCYDKCEKARTYILKFSNKDEVIHLKEKIRKIFNLGNHSIHSSDNYKETLLMTHLLYNENSIDLLNNGKLDFDTCLLTKLFDFKKIVNDKKISLNDCIVDSSSIMGLYGIRKVGDVDYLTSLDRDFELNDFDCNSEYSYYYMEDVYELITNPNLHCYAFDVKFITLDVLKHFKINRNQKKDIDDVILINEKLSERKNYKLLIRTILIRAKIKFRNYKTKIRMFFENNNILFFTKLFHFIKGKGFK